MSSPWKPDGYNSASPYLLVKDVSAVLRFLEAAFGGVPLRRVDRPDGSPMHVEVRIDDSVVMLGGAMSDWDDVPGHVPVYVPDVDAVYEQALDAGGASVQPPMRKDDPDKRAAVRGPGGHTWWIGTQMSDDGWGRERSATVSNDRPNHPQG